MKDQQHSHSSAQSNTSQPDESTPLNYFQQFKQQMFKAWLPIPTLSKTIILFYIMAGIFIAVGVPMAVLSSQIQQAVVNYDYCGTTTPCIVQLDVPAMKAPVFVYYQLHNYYQNHRLYASSINYDQLQGQSVSTSQIDTTCKPITTNADLYTTQSLANTTLNPNDIAYPCGMVAYTLFNDSYEIQYPNNTTVSVSTDGIAWPSDVNRYPYPSDPSKAWHDPTDPRFLNWIRIAPLPDFRKLWGRIDNDIPAGTYTINITNQYYISKYNSEKFFVLSTSNFFGSKNTFLYIMYLVMGGLCAAVATAFLIRKLRKKSKAV